MPVKQPDDDALGGAQSTARIEALSDNIFAVAMTLLVLDIKVPAHGTDSDLWPSIAPLWHHMRTFAVSFFIVGLYWVLHHHVFSSIRRSDRPLQWINLVFMLFVVVTPFSTGLLGAFDDSRTAIAVYGLNIILLGLSLQAIWWYATRNHRLVSPTLPPRLIRLETARILIMPAVCVLAIAVSFLDTAASIGLYLLAPLLYLWPGSKTIRSKSER